MSSNTQVVQFQRIENVAVLTMKFAPHNQVGKELTGALIEALGRAQCDGASAPAGE
ncbi:hypothetical protein [Rhodoferax ferrireducens]|uniref:hypothetical protein n=1 Tax=Rhodoferax ferrireducens TaxID=192843 RepID=UPI0013003AE7|nr:hypothetical protein [Rhodoferax ferrireducens]